MDQALGKVLSARSPTAIYKALICLSETYQCLSNISSARVSYVETSQRKNTISWQFDSTLVIPSVPVTFAKRKCGRGIAKYFTSLQDLQQIALLKAMPQSAKRPTFFQTHPLYEWSRLLTLKNRSENIVYLRVFIINIILVCIFKFLNCHLFILQKNG